MKGVLIIGESFVLLRLFDGLLCLKPSSLVNPLDNTGCETVKKKSLSVQSVYLCVGVKQAKDRRRIIIYHIFVNLLDKYQIISGSVD